MLLGMLAAWQRGMRAARPARWFAHANGAAVAAMLCKEIAIVGPFLLAAYDWAYSGDADRRPIDAPSPARAPRSLRRARLVGLSVAALGVAAALYPRVATNPKVVEEVDRSFHGRTRNHVRPSGEIDRSHDWADCANHAEISQCWL